jgi:hypothetical protein
MANVELPPKWPSDQQAQPAFEPTDPCLSEGGIVMNILNGMRAIGGRSAEVVIKLSLLTTRRKTTMDLKRAPHNRNTRTRARTNDRKINNQVLMWSRKIQPNEIPMELSTCPSMIQPTSKRRSYPRLRLERIYNVNNTIMKPKNIMGVKDNGYVVHKHGDRRLLPGHGGK